MNLRPVTETVAQVAENTSQLEPFIVTFVKAALSDVIITTTFSTAASADSTTNISTRVA